MTTKVCDGFTIVEDVSTLKTRCTLDCYLAMMDLAFITSSKWPFNMVRRSFPLDLFDIMQLIDVIMVY